MKEHLKKSIEIDQGENEEKLKLKRNFIEVKFQR